MNLREIFTAALPLTNEHDRRKYLEEACHGDAELLRQVNALLADHEQLGSFMEPPLADDAAVTQDLNPSELVNTQIGPYRLLQEIGSGGMGIVYLAHQSKPVDRRVALKIIKPGMDTRQVMARFEAERQALAIMDHPNIAKVFDAGQTDSGRPYFVMELVNGVPITEFCDQHHLTTRQRLELFVPVCMAMQHAHQKGVIHRDLKPSNILVTLYDDKPVPKVIDFGIAKAINQRLTERTLFTAFGHIVGTFEYMSPEQATRNQLDIDTRSDVYSLGVVLYELLTGDTPIDRQRLRNAAWDEVLRIIREEEPPLASSRVSSSEKLPSVAANRCTEPAKLSAFIRGELDWITAKALEKDRARRYESASSFAEDVRRFLRNEQVLACPPTVAYRAQKFIAKHGAAAAILTVVIVTALVGVIGTVGQARRAIKSEALIKMALDAEKRARNAESEQRSEAELQRKYSEQAREVSDSRLARLYLERGIQRIDSDPHADLPWLIEAIGTEPRTTAAAAAHRLRISLMVRELPKLCGYIEGAEPVFNDQATRVALIQDERQGMLYELPSLKLVKAFRLEQPVKRIVFTHDGNALMTIAGQEGGMRQGQIWNAVTGEPESEPFDLTEREFGMKEVPRVSFTPDDQRFTVVYAGMYNRWHSKMVARVYDRKTCQPISKPFAHHNDLDFFDGYHTLSKDCLRVLLPRGYTADDPRAPWVDPNFSDEANVVQQYDLMTGQPVHPPLKTTQDFYDFAVYDQESQRIATQGEGKITLWNAADGQPISQLELPAPVASMNLMFQPDGKHLMAIDRKLAMLWDLERKEIVHQWEHENFFMIAASGKHAIYNDANGYSYFTKIEPDKEHLDQRRLPEMDRAWFTVDGSRYVLELKRSNGKQMREIQPTQVFDTETGRALTPPWHASSRFEHDSLLSDDGRFLASIHQGVCIWDLNDRTPLTNEYPAEPELVVAAAAKSRDSSWLAVMDNASEVSIYDTDTEQLKYPPLEIDDQWYRDALVISSDAQYLVHVGDTKQCDLWDLKNRKQLWNDVTLHAEGAWFGSIDFLDSIKSVMFTEMVFKNDEDLTDESGTTSVYVRPITATETPTPIHVYQDSVQLRVVQVQGREYVMELVQVNEQDATVRLLDPSSWNPVGKQITLHCGSAANATLSPDGTKLVVGNGEIWDMQTGEQLHGPLVNLPVQGIVFHPAGDEFLLISEGGNDYWSETGSFWHFSIDGNPLSGNMVSPSVGELHCAMHREDAIVAAATSGLRIWDLTTSSPLTRNLELPGHRSAGLQVFMSPNGQRVYSVGDRVSVLDWGQARGSIPSDELLAAWAVILSGKRVDGTGPLDSATYRKAWETIRSASGEKR